MTTESNYNDLFNALLAVYDSREAALIADWVFENVTGLSRVQRRLSKGQLMNKAHVAHIQDHLEKLLQHKPVQYVLQESWFYKMKFFVDERVLIPRPETEELVSWVVEDCRMVGLPSKTAGLKFLDIGTGSGCIAIALKKTLRKAAVAAIDVSEGALAVAKKNADILDAKIQFDRLDFLDEKFWADLDTYDTIISNPPYISMSEKNYLAKHVTEFEPATALFVADDDPFIFYKKIAKFAGAHLTPGGSIYVEIHEDRAVEVAAVFNEQQFSTTIKEDIYGKKRMIKAGRPTAT
jgi:release factor glutamine methyltransferase